MQTTVKTHVKIESVEAAHACTVIVMVLVSVSINYSVK